VKATRDGMRWRQGPRLLRAVSDSLADQCPLPDTQAGLTRLQAAARDRGLLGPGVALFSATAEPEEKQAPSPHADLGATVRLADPPSSWLRRQRRRAQPIVSLAAATAVAAIVVVAALLHPNPHRHTLPPAHPPVASPTPSPSVSAAPLRLGEIAGTWTGQVVQNNPPDVFSTKITVGARSEQARISYNGKSFTCSGLLIPLSASHGQLILAQQITQGPCAGGTVTLTAQGRRALAFRFTGGTGPPATGILTRKKP
jgi:hypothetical protein